MSRNRALLIVFTYFFFVFLTVILLSRVLPMMTSISVISILLLLGLGVIPNIIFRMIKKNDQRITNKNRNYMLFCMLITTGIIAWPFISPVDLSEFQHLGIFVIGLSILMIGFSLWYLRPFSDDPSFRIFRFWELFLVGSIISAILGLVLVTQHALLE
jgi:hypothetical protein